MPFLPLTELKVRRAWPKGPLPFPPDFVRPLSPWRPPEALGSPPPSCSSEVSLHFSMGETLIGPCGQEMRYSNYPSVDRELDGVRGSGGWWQPQEMKGVV